MSCDYVRRQVVSVAPASAGRTEVLIAGIDPARFSRRAPYRPDGPIVATGRLVEKKGFDDLVAAAATLAPSGRLGGREVLVVGEGPRRAALEAQIAASAAPVRLLGARSAREVRDLLEGASAFALPCKIAADGDRDSMPVALKEAMALELPVLSTREVGIPELVGADRGRLVPPGDPEALAAGLGALLALAPEERAALGRAGAAWVREHCDIARETGRLADLIAGGRGGG